MADEIATGSVRREELLEAAYRRALETGHNGLSLRPLARAIGSSPRVLLFLFGSKDELIRAVLARARQDELQLLEQSRRQADLATCAREIWQWLLAPERRGLLRLWMESYARSLIEPDGPWAGFAAETVTDWLELLASVQPASRRRSAAAEAERTTTLALLRGALLDLLATGDSERCTRALHAGLTALGNGR